MSSVLDRRRIARAFWHERVSHGRCGQCGKRALVRSVRCAQCLEKQRVYFERRRRRFRRAPRRL